jgi:hypothetical protein
MKIALVLINGIWMDLAKPFPKSIKSKTKIVKKN